MSARTRQKPQVITRAMKGLRSYNKRVRKRYSKYIQATPHRSFRLTRRRDIPTRVELPGYFAFTHDVLVTIRRYRMPLIRLVLIVWVASLCMVGVSQQARYTEIQQMFEDFGKELFSGTAQTPTRIGAVFVAVASGMLNTSLSESQQIFLGLLYLLTWLTTIWLLRYMMAGSAVSVRDGLYNAGAPLVSIFLLLLVGMVQILPGAAAVFILSMAQNAGILVSGIEVGAFSIATFVLVVLSLYWVTSTFFAIIIATVPGTYPTSALRSARQVVVGQRMQILLRVLWLAVLLILAYSLILIPAVIIDNYLRLSWSPFVTIVTQFMTIVVLVYASTYIYLLYRRIIDECAN